MKPRAASDPAQRGGMLMRAVVVGNQVDLPVARRLPVDLLEKLQPFLVAMAWHATSDHGSIQRVQGGEEGRRPMPLIVMSHRAAAPLLDGQTGLGAVESLDLALLVSAQHQGVLRWVQV